MHNNYYKETDDNKTFSANTEGLQFEEEIELSKKILAGEAAKKALTSKKLLTENEWAQFLAAAEAGDQAYEQLVLANIPRAKKFAYETFRHNPFGLDDLEDYQQTAIKVICQCARQYDWKQGCRFGTFVHRCLQQEMIRENGKMGYGMRIPEENLYKISSLRNLNAELPAEKAAKELGMSTENAAKLLLASNPCKSLQDPLSDEDNDLEFGDMISDPSVITAEMVEEQIDLQAQLQQLSAAFALLPEDEKELLKGRMASGENKIPMKAFVGIYGKSISSVQKRQIAAVKHLRESYLSLPMAD